MNLRSIDLNLLTILDALLDEAHVTRAAERIGLSQSAASTALERCRHLFRDPLLERARGGMRRTAKAEALRAPLKSLLADAARLIDPPETPLGELRRAVRLISADLPAAALLAPLRRRLMASAPGVDLLVMGWRGAAAALDALEKGEADLAVSVWPAVPATIRCETLLEERYRVAMDRLHPAASGFDLDRWLAYPHLVVSGQGEAHGALDRALAERGRSRRVGLVVPSFVLAPSLLPDTDLIAMLPSRCVPSDPRLVAFEPPIPVDGFPLHLASHDRSAGDAAIDHVAAQIRACFGAAMA